MAATNTIHPDLQYNAAQSCLWLEFTSDKFSDTGTPAQILVSLAQIGLLTVDSSICFNGVTWTFAAAADLENNVLQFNPSPTGLASNISAAILNNGTFSQTFNGLNSFVDGNGLNITMPDCKSDAAFELKSLPNDAPNVVIKGNPTPMSLPEDYKIVAFFKCNGKDIEGIKECGVSIPAQVTTDCEECNVEEYKIRIDVSPYLCGCVSTPYPSFDQNAPIRQINRTGHIDWSFHEVCGSPPNSFPSAIGEDFDIINYAIQENEDERFLQVLNPSPSSDGTQFMTSYYNEDTICANQHNWMHLVLNPDTVTVQFIASFVTSSGGASLPYSMNIDTKEGKVLEIQSGLQNFTEFTTIDICDVERYAIRIREFDAAGNLTNHAFTYNVEKCCCISEFMFLNTQGVYETIALNCPKQIDIEAIREFCQTCQDCDTSIRTPKEKIIGMDCSEIFTIPFRNRNKYNDRIIKEFLCSTDVYYCHEGEFYSIKPETTVVTNYLRRGNPQNDYRFKINKARPLYN